jgi:hypothetical protein
MFHWRHEQNPMPGDAAYVARFAAMAGVLTRPGVVLHALKEGET